VKLADPKKVYWDSCVWLRYIEQGDGSDKCQIILDLAKRGYIKLWTSSLTLAEVYKVKCGDSKLALLEEQDINFENFIDQDFVEEAQVDHEIGVMARRLCRTHSVLKKPNDGIHLATAIIWNLDEFHTFDRDDLLRLNGSIKRNDGNNLLICKPSEQCSELPLFQDE